MKKLIFLILFISIICSCDLFFTGPHATNFHKENEIDKLSISSYISEKYASSTKYSFVHYYYVVLNEDNIEIYVLDENYEIYDAMKGTYTLEYLYYDNYSGNIDYNYIYDNKSDTFNEIDDSSNLLIYSYSEGIHWDILMRANNFNGDYLDLYLYDTERILLTINLN